MPAPVDGHAMICPVCDMEMTTHHAYGKDLDVCRQCGGTWFDEGEFRYVLDRLSADNAMKERSGKKQVGKSTLPVKEPRGRRLICPRCGILLDVIHYAFDSNVFVDKCHSCNGLWVDRGELSQIRDYLRAGDRFGEYADIICGLYRKKENRALKFIVTRQRSISLFIGAMYILLSVWSGGSAGAGKTAFAVVLFPLGLIWFGDTLGAYTGPIGRPPFFITKATPGGIVKLVGWIGLLSPLFIAIFECFS